MITIIVINSGCRGRYRDWAAPIRDEEGRSGAVQCRGCRRRYPLSRRGGVAEWCRIWTGFSRGYRDAVEISEMPSNVEKWGYFWCFLYYLAFSPVHISRKPPSRPASRKPPSRPATTSLHPAKLRPDTCVLRPVAPTTSLHCAATLLEVRKTWTVGPNNNFCVTDSDSFCLFFEKGYDFFVLIKLLCVRPALLWWL